MYKEIDYAEYSRELLKQLEDGAFLTIKQNERVNTMTIGWGTLGFIWNRPVFTVLVRYSRYTYDLINKAEDFTVSFPLKGQLKKELITCGTKSGRDMDKIKECGLILKDGIKVNSPIIDNCDLHLECKIIYKQPMDEKQLAPHIKERCYPKDDYHVLYYGEIIKAYIKE